jgi:hypothetical protein
MDTILKVEYKGDLRRALLRGTPDFAAVDRAVQEIWPGQSAQQTKYQDDEGDLCTLAAATFPDFLNTMKNTSKNQVLRLQLVPRAGGSQGSGSSVVTTDTSGAAEAFSSPWQHVEQGADEDSEGLHTVADLTDVQEPKEEASAPAAATALTLPVSAEDPGGRKEDVVKLDIQIQTQPALATTVTYAIDTPKSKPADDEKVEPTAALRDIQQESRYSDTVEAYADHQAEEKVDIIMAAFDENADGHLDFEEIQVLHRIAESRTISLYDYQQTCAAWCEDPEIGLSRKALLGIYVKAGPLDAALEQHFAAAAQKLQGLALQPHVVQQQVLRPRPCFEPSSLFPSSDLLLGEVASARKRFEGLSNKVRSGIAARSYRPNSCLGSKLKALF